MMAYRRRRRRNPTNSADILIAVVLAGALVYGVSKLTAKPAQPAVYHGLPSGNYTEGSVAAANAGYLSGY